MIGKNTEKAIKAWLKLPKHKRFIDHTHKSIILVEVGTGGNYDIVAKFSLASVVAKRMPKRKKAKK